jgi:hypothetical protein
VCDGYQRLENEEFIMKGRVVDGKVDSVFQSLYPVSEVRGWFHLVNGGGDKSVANLTYERGVYVRISRRFLPDVSRRLQTSLDACVSL